MKSRRYTQLATIALTLAGVSFAHSTGADPGYSGAPNDFGNCTACHSDKGAANSGGGKLTITFPDPNGWVAGTKYRLKVSLADSTAKRWGFQMTVRKEATNLVAGAFAVASGVTPVVTRIQSRGSLPYIEQTVNGTYALQTASASWDVDWTAPAAGTGTVHFYAAGNAANDNNDLTGDKIYTADQGVPEQTATSTPPPAITPGNTVFSQIAFGGGWYTAMYFTNQSSSQVQFNVNFYSDSANPLSIGGGTFQAVTIPPGGTSIIEAPNSGATTTTGWATFDIPSGVTGYGVFRQSVAGKADQEAVVPFANSTGTRALLTFDETSYTTALAIWYNGSSGGTISLTAKDENGSTLGTANLTLQPGTKQSFALISQIPAIAGHRGSVVVSASSGVMAVLGLRFSGSAFTSIPPAAAN